MVEEALRRRGLETPQTYRIVALDANTGQTQWQITDGIFGTWLGYSEQHKLLLQAGARASDRLQAEVGQGMRMYNAADGSLRWKIESLDYAGPCILHNDWVITNANSYSESAGAFDILTGRQRMVKHPLTGEILPWKMTRAYGCNNIIASENLLTFRSGAAGYYDLLTDSGTGNLGGFKSGCTSNLVVANGVLNAPDYTRTCSCAYQNQTSLALVHMPEVETWSVNALANAMDKDSAIRNLAINFGAAGDRPDASGTLWLEYPPVAGDSPPLSIRLNKNARFFQHHSSAASNASLPWIFSSGVELISDLDLELAFAPQKDDQPIITPDTAEQATKAEELHPYDIDFYFASQADSSTTPCVFDIFVQEQLMAAGVRLPSVEQGGIVHSIPGVQAGHTIRIRFKGQQSQPTLCGVHIRRTSN
jgi:hypothetical protein